MNDTSRLVLERELKRMREGKEQRVEQRKFAQETLDTLDSDIAAAEARIADLEVSLAQPEQAMAKERVLPPDATPGVFIGYEDNNEAVWLITWSSMGWRGNGFRRSPEHPSGFLEWVLFGDALSAMLVSCMPAFPPDIG